MPSSSGPNILQNGLILSLDTADVNSYPLPNVVEVQAYSVYGGGLRSANYTVQYSDDNVSWTTVFTGVMSNNSSCGLITGTGTGTGTYGRHRYWRYVEGSAVVSHHPRVSRIDLIDISGRVFNLVTYTSDNCSDSGTYIVGTVSGDFNVTTWYDTSGTGNNVVLFNGPAYVNANQGVLSFDGTDDGAYTSQNINFTGNFTIGMWVYITRWADPSSPCGGAISSLLECANGYWNMWGLETSGGGPFFFTYYNTSYGGVSLGFSGAYLNNWMYLVVSYNNLGTCVSYLNGTAVGSGTSPGTINPVGPIWINYFSQHCGPSRSQNRTARIEVYNRALAGTEVLQNYLANKARFNL